MSQFLFNHNIKTNNYNSFLLNQMRAKRTYDMMNEQNQIAPNRISLNKKLLKKNEGKVQESLIKCIKPRIPEKMLREIERYNIQRQSYNRSKIEILCPCKY